MNDALFNLLSWIRSWAGNWGLAMVIFTVLIRVVLSPLDYKSRKSMRKTTSLQPRMAELQKKYANDKEKLNQKTAELYKKEGVNPMSGCLPMLLTWPILIIVFSAMRQAANREMLGQITQILNNETPTMEPFLWIRNLWMPDNLFYCAWPDLGMMRQIPADMWQNWFTAFGENVPVLLKDLNLTAENFQSANLSATIQAIQDAMANGNAAYADAIGVHNGWTFAMPLLGTYSIHNIFNGFLILPVLSAVTQIIMTKISANQQTQPNPDAQGTGKFMTWFFPIFSLVICLGYSSAFALYWVTGNLVMMVQTVVFNKMLDKQDAATADVVGKGTVK